VGGSILVPDVQAGNVLVKSGVLTKDAKNKEMVKQGLEPIDNITSGPRETCISIVYLYLCIYAGLLERDIPSRIHLFMTDDDDDDFFYLFL
jgi:hypothetical protein